MRDRPRNWKDIAVKGLLFAWFIVLVLVVVSPYFSFVDRKRGNATLIRLARAEMHHLALAMEDCRIVYGAYPTGDKAAILKALMGTNSLQKVFSKLGPQSADTIADPWHSPYDVRVLSTNSISIRSAGRNRSFGDDYDIVINFKGTENQSPNSSSFR